MAAEANLSLFRQHAAVILAQQSALKAVRHGGGIRHGRLAYVPAPIHTPLSSTDYIPH